eukprot:TRINITY_DN22687_c0_g1_i1.p1 TRINITY_DN22687_c0_g1~~TRINITY_DN22687_c0_g1_i1.p1  ORF type:complete len:315 (+),score=43.31 TRINITY_DN22687_c0_g1_i1:75-1019(+)
MNWIFPMWRRKSTPTLKVSNVVRNALCGDGEVLEGDDRREILRIAAASEEGCRMVYDEVKRAVRMEGVGQKIKALSVTITLLSENAVFFQYATEGGLGMEVREHQEYRGEMDLLCGDAMNKKVRELATQASHILSEGFLESDPTEGIDHRIQVDAGSGNVVGVRFYLTGFIWGLFQRFCRVRAVEKKVEDRIEEGVFLRELLEKEEVGVIAAEKVEIYLDGGGSESEVKFASLLLGVVRAPHSDDHLRKALHILTTLAPSRPATTQVCVHDRHLLLPLQTHPSPRISRLATNLCRSISIAPSTHPEFPVVIVQP